MKRFVVLIGAFGIVLSVALPARAHTAIGSGGYYNRRWKVDLHLPWRFASNFPGGAYRDKIIYGVGQWNNQGQPLYWTQYGDIADFNWRTCPATFERNVIHWAPIDKAGYVQTCVWGDDHNRLWSTNMAIDSDGSTKWYTGSSTPPAGTTDLWSVATHEWGHMSGSTTGGDGLGHFPESDAACPETTLRNAMCPSAISDYGWNTKTHDEHTFQSAY